jgi:hypothetical protein
MGTVVYYTGLVSPRLRFCSKKIVGSSVGVQRQQVLEQVDKELSKGDERAALSLVKDLQGKPGGLRCFGAGRQVGHQKVSHPSVFTSSCGGAFVFLSVLKEPFASLNE